MLIRSHNQATKTVCGFLWNVYVRLADVYVVVR